MNYKKLTNNAIHKFSQIPLVDNKDNKNVNLLKTASTGPEKKQLKKLSIDPDEIQIEIKPDHAYLHIVTVGAGEYYSANLKGDYYHESPKVVKFPYPHDKEEKNIGPGLKDCHHTFMNADGIYRNHKYDTPPLGNIVWQRYHEPMHRGEVIAELPLSIWQDDLNKYESGQPLMFSQGCFIAGSLVRTPNGYYPIELLKENDEINTHTNKIVKIAGTKELDVSGKPMNTIKVAGGFEATSTDYHMYFVVNKKDIRPVNRYLKEYDVLKYGKWKQAKDLEIEQDFIAVPFETNFKVTKEITPDIAQLAGYYLAEGSILYSQEYKNLRPTGIRLSCHRNEFIANNVEGLCKRIGINSLSYRYYKGMGEAVDIDIYDSGIAQAFKKWLGEGSKTKYISEYVMKWPIEFQKYFLGAYLDGDGYCCVSESKYNVMANTAGKELALGLQLLFARVGDATGILSETGRTSKSLSTPLGYTINYKLRCSKLTTMELYPYCNKIPEPPENIGDFWRTGDRIIYDNQILAKVKSNKSFFAEEGTKVYDIHVDDDDHSYTVNNLSVHNSHIRGDLCSACGYEFTAKSPKRCDHMRNHKLEILDDGTQVFVYNPKPDFYELSEVGQKPAMKIAFCLKKVADTNQDISEISHQLIKPRNSIDTVFIIPDKSEKKRIINELSSAEKKFHCLPNKKDEDAVRSFKLDDQHIKDIVNNLKNMEWAELLPALKNKNCMLTPKIFHSILSSINDEPDNMPGVSEFEEAVKNIYSDIKDSEDEKEILEDVSYSSEPFPTLNSAISSVEPFHSSLSLDPECSALRSLSNKDKPVKIIMVKKSSEAENESAKFLAKEYAKYQTEFLAEKRKDSNIYLAAACNQS